MKHITVQTEAANMMADFAQMHGAAIGLAVLFAIIGAYVFSE